jgi:S-adenosylmethionine synthetase
MNLKYKTTECVSAGHPDKVADVIADSILDACLLLDPKSKVACEVMVKDDVVVLGGEITTNCNPESLKIVIECVVNECVGILGYTRPELKFCRDRLKIINLISKQSQET